MYRMKTRTTGRAISSSFQATILRTLAFLGLLAVTGLNPLRAADSSDVDCGSLAASACSGEDHCRLDGTKCRKKNPLSPRNSDIGIAVNVIDQEGAKNDDGESKGFRFFDGASIYYSLGRREDQLKMVINLSTLDFDEKIDFETGVAVGVLFKPKDDADFTISLVRGYNLMTDGSGDGWYNLVGFGWNFNRSTD